MSYKVNIDPETGHWDLTDHLEKLKTDVQQASSSFRAGTVKPFRKPGNFASRRLSKPKNNHKAKEKPRWNRAYCQKEMESALMNANYPRATAFGIAVLVANGEGTYKRQKRENYYKS